LVPLLALVCASGAFAEDEEPRPEKHEWRSAAKLGRDFKRFYSEEGAPPLLIGIGAAGVMANSSIDECVQDWYQDSVRNGTTDDLADVFKVFGEAKYVVPASLGAYLWARLGRKPRSSVGHWGERTLRGLIVGAPTLLVVQRLTGASRPSDGAGSGWVLFEDTNGASGHAFVASVPFLTAANMTREKWVKGVLYFASTLTAWSRINDDQHYLSQSALGWWIGYLATRVVTRNERGDRLVRWTPHAGPGSLGFTATIRLGNRRNPSRREDGDRFEGISGYRGR
jgi:hypothetical protein